MGRQWRSPWSIDTNDGDLGVGGTADGSNLFKGWIDDLRFYDTTLHPKDVKESYGKGAGDFGATPTFTVNRATSVMPINVSLSFLDSDLFPVTIQGFESFRFSARWWDSLKPPASGYELHF